MLSLRGKFRASILGITPDIRFFLHPLPPKGFGLSYLGLTNDSTIIRPCGAYPVVSYEFIKTMRMDTFSAVGIAFSHLKETRTFKSTHLPFWLQPVRSHLAVCRVTQFSRYLRLCSSFYPFSLAPKLARPCQNWLHSWFCKFPFRYLLGIEPNSVRVVLCGSGG